MESVTQDEHVAITPAVPASPPRRDSMEDADPSLTRKRPRLDSGSNDNCAMSTDPVPGAADTTIAPSAEQAVEMTIRSQPPSSSQPTDGADDIDIVSAHAMSAQETSAPIVDNTEDDLTLDLDKDTTVGSPPVLAVDEEEEDAMGDYIQVDLNPEDYYRQFPYASSGDYMGAVRSIINHFHGCKLWSPAISPMHADNSIAGNLDGTVLPQVALWLDNFPTQPSQWQGYFIDKHSFWDEFSQLVNKVLIRRYQWMNALANRDQDNDTSRYPFGEQFADEEQSEDLIFYDFLRSYLEISARLLQVDVDRLSGSTYEGFYSQPLLVQKHLRLINNIIRQEKAPIFHLLNKDYQTDTRKMMHRLTRDFIHASGLEHLFHFAHAICGRVELGLQNWLASGVVQILNQLGWTFLDLPNQGSVVNRSQFCRNVLDLFRKYNLDLQVPSKVLDITVTKELLAHLADLLSSLCQWHETIASELAKEFMDYRDPWSPTPVLHDAATISQYDELRSDSANHAALATNAWKFKLLRKYVVKGRMELRVTSIGIMDSALIDIWREYNGTEHGTDHPIMQYLADFLLREEVVEYIMSVDSHPQIISRSGNVVGFLVVTHRYSDDQTDAIWKTVSHSPDPRVVAATINMLKVIIHLMSAEEQLYLCLKLYQLPIESYTMDIFRFFRELAPKVQVRHLNCSIVDPRSRPWNVCIRIIQDTSPSRDSTKLNGTMYTEACDQLRLLASSIVADERHQIYEACTSYIADRSPKATGSVRAMFILFSGAGFPDNDFFKQNLRIGRHLVEELCAFVKAERQLSFHNTQYISLLCRLDMLCLLLFRAFDAIPVDLYQDLWDHLVGKFALNNQLRDQAWSKFSDYIRHRPENEFFKQLILTYVPRLEPEYYTGGVYEFVASYKFPTTKKLVNTEEGEKEVLQIRGADLLWPMVLNAPMNTIEGRSAKLLAARYVEIDIDQGVSLEEVEEAHVALVEKCTRELLAAYQIIRGKRAETASTVDIGNQMDISVPDQIKQQNELRFSRTLLFQKDLLASIRTKPEFNRSQRSDSKVEALQPELAYMGAIEIKYQSPTTNDKQSVFVNPENTVQDLYTRICNATGFTRVNLFAKGQRLNLLESGSKKVTDMDFGGLLLVQKAPGSGISQPVTGPGATCSVFETTVLKHFEELFACMDSDDHISETVSTSSPSLTFIVLTCISCSTS
jgi:ubiquitin carboxyl-terminal hydrolase 34